ncbi:MAG TPA: hypothetical protein VGK96_07490 [Candidatus Sulfotelmatobacter sp.]
MSELIQGGLEVFDDLSGKNGRVGEIGGIAQAVVAEPEDVEVGFVAFD